MRRLSILTVAALVLSQLNWEGEYMKADYQMIDGLWWSGYLWQRCGAVVRATGRSVVKVLDTQLPPVDCKA